MESCQTLTTHVQAPALTLYGAETITGLVFTRVDENTRIPRERGIYVWADTVTTGVVYPGSASGTRGLYSRLYKERRLVREAREGFGANVDLVADAVYAPSYPLIRSIIELDLHAYFTVTPSTQHPQWECESPRTALDWECLLFAANHRFAGNRAILGQAALKSNIRLAAAWDRLDRRLTELRGRGVV